MISRFQSIIGGLRTHRLGGRAAVAVGLALVLVGLAVLVMRARLREPVSTLPGAPMNAAAPDLQLPGQLPGDTQPGLLKLPDFQIVIPAGWQRRRDWEDAGPGTKLFLLGPKAGTGQLVIGIDVYPLPKGTTLEQFVKQYSQKWNAALLTQEPATFCGQQAQMLQINENGLDKLYLVTVSDAKGFAIGMMGPAGTTASSAKTFRQVLDTFQFYQ